MRGTVKQREMGKRLNIGETVIRLMKNRVAASRAHPVTVLSCKFIHSGGSGENSSHSPFNSRYHDRGAFRMAN